ncbi:MAG: RecQ family ATP-dependent DNA helicase [Bdellovibrionaceae bacterium]|nr:RecQ family ATP-dependent DNA helicase [Pseudobdellovibrionaceae bacterium]MDW8189567.1 RecQ family ATP-dependent DNA helicase [Pseudobdellovibrionaceae bacterium]
MLGETTRTWPSHWPIKALTPWQERAWDELRQGRSGLVVLPTGGGKTLLVYLWSYHNLGSLTVVLTPLIALIEDQVKRARAFGFQAWGMHSGQAATVKQGILERIKRKQVQILFVTPERFRNESFREVIHKVGLGLLVVDEAHLISQWGYDFRPDYQRVTSLIEEFKPAQILALTATATLEVKRDILSQLKLGNGFDVTQSIVRSNLSLRCSEAVGVEQKRNFITRFWHSPQNQRFDGNNNVDHSVAPPGPTVTYFSLIKSIYEQRAWFESQATPLWIYHGDLSAKERKKIQKMFQESSKGVMLATNAFGLGVDKKNIRCVIHFEVPGSIESYYQEVGRAGRDGYPAWAFLCYDPEDLLIQMEFIKWSNPEPDLYRRVWDWLWSHRTHLSSWSVESAKKELFFYNQRDFRLETILKHLEFAGYLIPDKNSFGYRWNDEFSQSEGFNFSWSGRDRAKIQHQKLMDLVTFIKNVQVCRMQQIAAYFGESTQACGQCDVCIK